MTGSLTTVALAGLAWTASLALVTWAVSLVRHDASLVDRVWAILIAGAGLVYLALLPAPQTARGLCMALIGSAWALRLCIYITWRNWGHGEDRRYQTIRARNQPNFGFKSLYLVFALQAVLAWIVSAPFLPGMAAERPLGLLDALGAALGLFGFVFEAVGDAQMARFKADPANRGQVMDRGLWRYTRHPNYFGDACVWWGIWLVGGAASGWVPALVTVVSPLAMTYFIRNVTGAKLLEKTMSTRPGWDAYAARVPLFVPRPPRRS